MIKPVRVKPQLMCPTMYIEKKRRVIVLRNSSPGSFTPWIGYERKGPASYPYYLFFGDDHRAMPWRRQEETWKLFPECQVWKGEWE